METTYLILDVNPSMAEVFEDAVDYLIDLILAKVMRGKKRDKVAIVTLHDDHTRNTMNDRSPKQWLNCVVDEPVLYDWKALIGLQRDRLRLNKAEPLKYDADLARAFAITLQEIADKLGGKRGGATKYTVVLVSDLASKTSWKGMTDPLVNLAQKYDVEVGVVYFEGDSESHRDNLIHFEELVKTLRENADHNGMLYQSFCRDFDTAKGLVRDVNKEEPKEVKPTGIFQGEIRLCCDTEAIDLRNALNDMRYDEDLSAHLPDYTQTTDPYSVSFQADGFPLTKDDKPTVTTEIGVRQREDDEDHYDIFGINQVREHYVYENEDEPLAEGEERPTKIVDTALLQKAYRYGSSIVPATTSMERQLEMVTYAGIDILGFVKRGDIPPWYYRGETILLLPRKKTNEKDLTAFNLFAQAMMSTEVIAVARVVQRPKRPAILAALIPNVVLTERTKEPDQLRQYYSLALVKLFFKDDEKIPVLPPLTGRDDPEAFPSDELVSSMTKFVNLMDLDELNASEEPDPDLVLPHQKGIQVGTSYGTPQGITPRLLSRNSPQIHLMQKVVRAIYHFELGDAQEEDSLYDMVEAAKTQPVDGEEGMTAFDIIFEQLGQQTVKDGRNTFVPELYDERVVQTSADMQAFYAEMAAQAGVQKIEPKKEPEIKEEEVKQELTPVGELLGLS